jgi:replicative DNA helicase
MAKAVRDPHLVPDFFSECPLSSFRTEPAASMAAALNQCFTEKGGIDVYRVAQLVRASNSHVFVQMGESAGIASMFNNGLAFEHDVLNGARAVHAEHMRQTALVAMQGIASAIAGSPTYGPDEIAGDLAQLEKDMRSGSLNESLDTWTDYFEELQERISRPEATLIKTPWEYLDRVLNGGVEPEELIVLAGRPGTGKTALAVNWSNSVAASGKSVAFVSLEVSSRQIRNRILASTMAVEYGKFRKGMTQSELEMLREASTPVTTHPVEILDKANCTVAVVRKFAKHCAVKGKLGLIVVDYLQLLRPEKQSGSREQDVAEMSRSLKLLARELGVPVLLLAQMNRQSEGANREPMLSDLRESGAIEQDADIVIFLQGIGDEKQSPRGVKALVKKGRSSGQGVANLEFDGRIQLFQNDVYGLCSKPAQTRGNSDDNGLA